MVHYGRQWQSIWLLVVDNGNSSERILIATTLVTMTTVTVNCEEIVELSMAVDHG